jgi:guanylate cyclase
MDTDRPRSPGDPLLTRLTNLLLSIGAHPADPPDLRQRKRLTSAALWFSLLHIAAFAVVRTLQGAPLAGAVLGGLFVGIIGSLTILWRNPSRYADSIHIICLLVIVISLALTVLYGGLLASGGEMVWAFISPLFALIGLGVRAARFWLLIFLAAVIAGAALPLWVPAPYTLPNPELVFAVTLLVVSLFIYLLLIYFVRQRDHFQRLSDDLLRNILPAEIAERLKAHGGLIADRFDQASILFADVVGFTPLAAQLSASEVVSLLDEVFSAIDHLVEMAGLEKIKTIGDSYMVAAGVPHARPDHAHALARLALDMQALVAAREFRGHRLHLRIGIHSGPLVAGVIGQRRFSYDLWGDTVNIASRMESQGAEDLIQITRQTYDLIQDAFVCCPRGRIQVKGKGEMEVFELRAAKESLHP